MDDTSQPNGAQSLTKAQRYAQLVEEREAAVILKNKNRKRKSRSKKPPPVIPQPPPSAEDLKVARKHLVQNLRQARCRLNKVRWEVHLDGLDLITSGISNDAVNRVLTYTVSYSAAAMWGWMFPSQEFLLQCVKCNLMCVRALA